MTVAIAATGCGTASQQAQSQLPSPPSVTEMSYSIPAYPDDGLFRLIVTPKDDASTVEDGDSTARSDPPVVDAGGAGSALPGERWTVSSDRLDEADDATLIFQDGVPGFFDDSGSFVPLADATGSSDPVPDLGVNDGQSFGHPLIDALARNEDVTSIAPIGDGRYAVVATSREVVDGLDLEVMDDLALGFSGDTYSGYQWAFDNTGHNLDLLPSPPPQIADADIDGAEAVPVATGRGVVVAVVDSGVDFSHPDLAGKSWVNADEDCTNGVDDDANGFIDDCRGWDFAADDNVPFVPGHHAHGTHVAGIIAATADNNQGIAGIAPDVRIMDLSVSPTGSMTTSSIARAIRYAADNGADIVNLSLGTSPGVPITSVTPIVDAVHYAEAAGVLLVIAAGNDGIDLTAAPVYPASVNATNVLAVGASSPAETKASFSNYGSAVDVFAPGEFIVSTIPNNDYTFMSGTSQATPITAAVAALVLEQRPDTDPASVIDQLVGTADELAAYASYLPSAARLNAARAVGVNPSTADGAPPIVAVRGLADASPEAVAAEITLHAPSDQYGQPLRWEASLVLVRPEGIYAVVDHQISIDGVSRATDDRGAVTLGQEPAMVANLSTSLPDGTYGLVVEAVPVADPTLRLDDAFITTFVVGEPTPTTTPTDPGAGSPTEGGAGTGGQTPSNGKTPPTDPGTQPTYPQPTYPQPTYPVSTYLQPTFPQPTYPQPTYPVSTYPQSTYPVSDPDPGPGGGGTAPAPSPSWWQPTPTSSPSPVPGDQSGGGTPTSTTTSTSTTMSTSTTSPSPGPGATTPAPTDSPTSSPASTLPTGPGDVANGGWAIASIAPRSGPIAAGTFVSLGGSFPREVSIWFGNLRGTVYAQTDSWIVVRTPSVDQPGTVELTVRSRTDGTVLTVPDGFTYLDLGSQWPTTTTAPVGGGGGTPSPTTAPSPSPSPTTTPSTSGGGAGGGTAPTPDSGTSPPATSPGAGPTTSGPTTSSPATSSPATSSPDAGSPGTGTSPGSGDVIRQPQVRALLVGDPIDLGNGLQGRALSGLGEISGIPACSSNPCRTRRIQG